MCAAHPALVWRRYLYELDVAVGRVVAALEKAGLAAEDTVIVFASDNGAPPAVGVGGRNYPLRGAWVSCARCGVVGGAQSRGHWCFSHMYRVLKKHSTSSCIVVLVRCRAVAHMKDITPFPPPAPTNTAQYDEYMHSLPPAPRPSPCATCVIRLQSRNVGRGCSRTGLRARARSTSLGSVQGKVRAAV